MSSSPASNRPAHDTAMSATSFHRHSVPVGIPVSPPAVLPAGASSVFWLQGRRKGGGQRRTLDYAARDSSATLSIFLFKYSKELTLILYMGVTIYHMGRIGY